LLGHFSTRSSFWQEFGEKIAKRRDAHGSFFGFNKKISKKCKKTLEIFVCS
jgi:hypothetical protein